MVPYSSAPIFGRRAGWATPTVVPGVPPPGLIGGAVTGVGFTLPVNLLNEAQVSNRPSLARRVAPRTRVVPLVPTTAAQTIRGERPRCSTLMPRYLPWTSEPSLEA